MNPFVYDIPTRVYFGPGQLKNLGGELRAFGKRALLVYGGGSIKRTGLYDKVVSEVRGAGLELFELSGIEPNPRVDSVRKGARLCREKKIDVILAVGGGSVIDAAKFIGAGAFYDGDPWDLSTGAAEITGCLPLVTVLTLAATGSEMDAGGVISNPETKDKIGRMDFHLQPQVSFLDPTNTYTVNAYQTACGSVDILSHLFEVYFNTEPDLYMLDCMMEGLIKTVLRYAPVAIAGPDDYEARANLMWASSWAINGFINGGKDLEWTCHPIEHEVSAIYDITHGLGLAILTPRWLEYCLDETTVSRYRQFAVNVLDIDKNIPPMEAAKLAIAKLREFFFTTLGLASSFTELGIGDENFRRMSEKACGDVIRGFKTLAPDDVEKILRMCL